jgi:hypothetical protein
MYIKKIRKSYKVTKNPVPGRIWQIARVEEMAMDILSNGYSELRIF